MAGIGSDDCFQAIGRDKILFLDKADVLPSRERDLRYALDARCRLVRKSKTVPDAYVTAIRYAYDSEEKVLVG